MPRTPGRTASRSTAARLRSHRHERVRARRRTGRLLWRHLLVTPARRGTSTWRRRSRDGLVYAEHDRAAAGRPRRPLRARRAHREDPLAALDDPRSRGTSRRSRAAAAPGTRRASRDGDVYWGTTNPYPYGGKRAHPNGGAYGGAALYTDSLARHRRRDAAARLVRPGDAARRARLRLPAPAGARLGRRPRGRLRGRQGGRRDRLGPRRPTGGSGRRRSASTATTAARCRPRRSRSARACSAASRRRWRAPTGASSSRSSTSACAAARRATSDLDRVDVAARGRGELVALDAATGHTPGRCACRRPTSAARPSPTASSSPRRSTAAVYGVDTRTGRVLWRAHAGAGINSCPALAAGTLLVGAGVRMGSHSVLQLTAFRPRSGS